MKGLGLQPAQQVCNYFPCPQPAESSGVQDSLQTEGKASGGRGGGCIVENGV